MSKLRPTLPSEQDRRKWDLGEDIMDELIDRIVAHVGVDRSVAEKAVGIILDFLLKEGPSDEVQSLVDGLPGANAAAQAARADGDAGGMFSGTGGVMGIGSRLMGAGLGMQQIRGATGEVIAYTREKASNEVVEEIVGAVPGLGQFI
jgi:hypothetical protein